MRRLYILLLYYILINSSPYIFLILPLVSFKLIYILQFNIFIF